MGLGFPISNPEKSLISTLLVALTTPWLVIFGLGPQTPIESGEPPTPHFISRETEAWRSYDLSCPSPPSTLNQLFLPW